MNIRKVMQVGMGPLGQKMYQMARERQSVRVISAVDVNPELIGRDLGKISGGSSVGKPVFGSIEQAIAHQNPDIALVTTVSDMRRITPLVIDIVSRGIPVVSTCEELSYAWEQSRELAEKINAAAREHGVAVLGTGVNPGFLMDSLPSFLTGVCQQVEHVHVSRYQDAQHRRIPFQIKIGAGLDLESFELRKKDGSLRHVGLTESMQFIARQLGWKLDRTEDVITPVIAVSELHIGERVIQKGQATGICQVGRGFIGEVERVKLVFQAAVGEPESFDEVRITGTPDIRSRIDGGVNGDIATCAITLNAIPSVLSAQPGLRTMADIPIVSCQQ